MTSAGQGLPNGIVMSMSTAAGSGDGMEVVVDGEGNLVVSAAELARHGYRPGAHLRLVADVRSARHKTMRGAYAHLVTDVDLDAFEAAMGEAKAARVAQVETELS